VGLLTCRAHLEHPPPSTIKHNQAIHCLYGVSCLICEGSVPQLQPQKLLNWVAALSSTLLHTLLQVGVDVRASCCGAQGGSLYDGLQCGRSKPEPGDLHLGAFQPVHVSGMASLQLFGSMAIATCFAMHEKHTFNDGSRLVVRIQHVFVLQLARLRCGCFSTNLDSAKLLFELLFLIR